MNNLPSINEQLNIPLIKGGAEIMQPQLFDGDLAEYRANDYNYRIVRGSAYWNAAGDWNNLWGTWDCKKTCKSLFPSDAHLEDACKNMCTARCSRKSKCPESFSPTRSIVCRNAGLNADCTSPTGEGGSVTAAPTPTSSPSGGPKTGDTTGTGMSKGAKMALGIGVVALIGVGVYFGLKKAGKI